MSDFTAAEIEWMGKLQGTDKRVEIPPEILERLTARNWVTARGDGSIALTGSGLESLVRIQYKLPVPETSIDDAAGEDAEASEEADETDTFD